jgi:hypothetical protein
VCTSWGVTSQWLAQGLDGGDYKFLTTLREQGRTVVLVGFDERTAAIQQNAETVIAAILRTIAERVDNERLTVGGLSMGGWPRIPRTIAVANGTGDGTGLPVPPGDLALKSTGLIAFPGTTFHTQASGDDVTVAQLKRLLPPAAKKITTSGYPELDGAPGGTLASYRIVAEELEAKHGKVDLRHGSICFVPTVSAVAIRDIDKQDDLYAKVDALDPQESEVHEFLCSSTTTPHTAITRELGEWIVDRLPR